MLTFKTFRVNGLKNKEKDSCISLFNNKKEAISFLFRKKRRINVFFLSNVRPCLLYLISFFIFSSYTLTAAEKTASDSYSIFDDTIYDQSELFETYPNITQLNEYSYREKVLQHLTCRKVDSLEKKLFSIYDKELEDLNRLMKKYEPSATSKALKGSAQFIGAISGLGILAIPGVGPELEAMRIFMGVSAAGNTVGAGMMAVHEFLQPNGHLDLDKLKSAVMQKKRMHILNVNREPGISDLEIEYVLKKPFIRNKEFEKGIEDALISMRKPGIIPISSIREFVINYLKLPLIKKEIAIDSRLLNLVGKNIGDFGGFTSFQKEAAQELFGYSDKVKYDLANLMLQIRYSSRSDITSHRRFYYLYGDPGIGKTTAARNIAKFLQLPLFVRSIRTGQDLSEIALEGQDPLCAGANIGFLARALSTELDTGELDVKNHAEDHTVKVSLHEITRYGLPSNFSVDVPKISNRTYRNAILLINDFDRILMDPNTTTQTLAFFLDYLDPTKESFFCPYFKSYVSIKDLIIIITGNYPIPMLNEQDKVLLQQGIDIHDQQHASIKYRMQFQALKDRIVEIKFDKLEGKGRIQILERFMREMLDNYRISLTPQISQGILSKTENIASIRDAKKYIEEKILDEKQKNPADVFPVPQTNQAQAAAPEQKSNNPLIKEVRSPLYIATAYLDEVDVQKHVNALEEVNKDISLLLSYVQKQRYEGVKYLFGEFGKFRDSRGKVENFWETARRGTYKEKPGSVHALVNRVKRFKLPQQQGKVIRFHVQAAKALLDSLLKIEVEDKFVWEALVDKKDTYRRGNLETFVEHLKQLDDFTTKLEEIQQSSEDKIILEDEIKNFLGETFKDIRRRYKKLDGLVSGKGIPLEGKQADGS